MSRPDPDPLHPGDDRWIEGYFDGYGVGYQEGRTYVTPFRRGPSLGGLLLVIGVTAVFWLAVGFFAGRASAAGPSAPAPEPSFVPVPTMAGEVRSVPSAPAVKPTTNPGLATPKLVVQPRPTPRPKPAPVARGHVRSGTASWYDDPRKSGLYAAAGPPLRVGDWRGRTVTVSAGGHSFRVVLSDWCACSGKVIDLSPAAFSRLADLSRGLTRVMVTW